MLSSIPSMLPAHDISLGSIHLGRGNPLFLIAGPCVIANVFQSKRLGRPKVTAVVDVGIRLSFRWRALPPLRCSASHYAE
jgi:hypothetical protein